MRLVQHFATILSIAELLYVLGYAAVLVHKKSMRTTQVFLHELVRRTLLCIGLLTSRAVAVRADPRAALADEMPAFGRLVTEDGQCVLTS